MSDMGVEKEKAPGELGASIDPSASTWTTTRLWIIRELFARKPKRKLCCGGELRVETASGNGTGRVLNTAPRWGRRIPVILVICNI